MSILFCKGCNNQLRKFKRGKIAAKWVVVKKRNGKWVEVRNKEHEKGVEKDEKIFFKCLDCGFLNELPEYISSSRRIQKKKKITLLHPKT